MVLSNAIVTAYCYGVLTANGHRPVEGVTIAAPRCVPFNTLVCIDQHWYRVDDRTHRRYDGRWDIYMRSRWRALRWGIQRHNITIIWPKQSKTPG